MLALLVPSFEGSAVEGFARAVVSPFAPPFLAPKTPALNPCIPNTCNLIENNGLYPLHSQHLQKTGGGGIYRSLGQTTPANPFHSHNSNSPNHNSFPLINLQKTKGYTHQRSSDQSTRQLALPQPSSHFRLSIPHFPRPIPAPFLTVLKSQGSRKACHALAGGFSRHVVGLRTG